MLARSVPILAILVGSAVAHAEAPDDDKVPVVAASGETDALRATEPPRTGEPAPADAPDPDTLANAPPADRASGIAVAPPQRSHSTLNAMLAVPRAIAVLLVTGPRYAAAGIDAYLERRSPNAFSRDVQSSWRFGAEAGYETALGASVAARVGYQLGTHASVDAYGGGLGARGLSGGLRASLGRYTALRLEPSLTLDAGRNLSRAFAGVGETGGVAGNPYARGPRIIYNDRRVELGAAASIDAGPVAIIGRAARDYTAATEDSEHPFVPAYEPGLLVGFDEAQRASTGELAVVYDGRSPAGFYARGTAAYVAGDAERTGAFRTGRFTLEARQVFDLFHADRLLSIGVRGETVTAGVDELPFDRLPALGGRAWLRAFARDELRDRAAAAATLEYEWPLDDHIRAFVFGETGEVARGLGDFAASRLHVGYGGGLRAFGVITAQAAGSEDGDFGLLVQLGAL